jgi:hypothetical protein
MSADAGPIVNPCDLKRLRFPVVVPAVARRRIGGAARVLANAPTNTADAFLQSVVRYPVVSHLFNCPFL